MRSEEEKVGDGEGVMRWGRWDGLKAREEEIMTKGGCVEGIRGVGQQPEGNMLKGEASEMPWTSEQESEEMMYLRNVRKCLGRLLGKLSSKKPKIVMTVSKASREI
jgi:hypothetical protein